MEFSVITVNGHTKDYLRSARSNWFAYALLSVSISLGLVVSEAGLQLHYRLQNGSWLWENSAFRIGYTQPIHDRREYTLRPQFKDEESGITINQFGFREPYPYDTSAAVIVCSGDSVPFGAGVKDNETYSSQLGSFFRSEGLDIAVINAGIPSYNLRQSFDRVRIDVLPHFPLKHIRVLTIEAANDISLLTHYRETWNPNVTWADVRWSDSWVTKPAFQKLGIFFYLFTYLEEKPSDVILHRTSASSSGNGPAPYKPDKSEEMLDHLRKVLKEELAFYQKQGVRTILMPINPFYYQISHQEKNASLKNFGRFKHYVDEWDELIGRYNQLLAEVSREFAGVYFLDTRTIMDSLERDQMYIDYIHHTPLGNHIRAQALFDFIRDNGLI